MWMEDTVAAVSTPYGKGGVALLRVCGEEALAVAAQVFRPRNGRPLSECAPRTAVLGDILAPSEEGWQVVDEGLATVFYAPSSFTGETTVEICCHGGILLTETVLAALLAAGARAAEAGEFTRRAFLNGKLGLSSAEALGDLLEASNREQLALAHNGLRGRLGTYCRSLGEKLTDLLAAVYARIDYPDEDLAEHSPAEILSGLAQLLDELRALGATYRTGHAIVEGVRTVICGRPNVGKSSLYNRIIGREAAIVTEIEGTTRDVLTADASLGRVRLRLSDTAGLRGTEDPVERIGIDRARGEMEEAELILALFDGGCAPDTEDEALVKELKGARGTVVAVVNKCDLLKEDMTRFCRAHVDRVVCISAQSGEGIEKLCALVEGLFVDGRIRASEDAILTNARQEAAVRAACSALEEAIEGLRRGAPMDACCFSAERALAALGEVDGRAVSEDVVSRIFARFCVGK